MAKRIAVVLAGSGRADGSEIHESVSVLVHLSRRGWEYRCFAPDAPQTEVVNHATGERTVDAEPRNMMVEAARISRGDISPLEGLHAADFDAVVFPGGFGAAKNLCDFAFKGAQCEVRADVERVIKDFHGEHKPIALCCIAPVLAARVLGAAKGGAGCEVTVGCDAGVASAIEAMGSRTASRGVSEICIDRENWIVTTPAYMHDARPHQVFDGIGAMVGGLATLLGV